MDSHNHSTNFDQHILVSLVYHYCKKTMWNLKYFVIFFFFSSLLVACSSNSLAEAQRSRMPCRPSRRWRRARKFPSSKDLWSRPICRKHLRPLSTPNTLDRVQNDTSVHLKEISKKNVQSILNLKNKCS